MVCLSVDQFAENLLENNGVDVKRLKLEERSGNFEVEMDSGTPGPTLEPRPDEEMPTATAPMEIPTAPPPGTSAGKAHTRDTSSQEPRRRRCGGHDGDGDLRPILRGSCENEGDWQSRPLHKHSRSAYSRAAERGRQIDRHWPDYHSTQVTSTQERHLCDDGIAGASCHFQRQVHHYCEHRLGDSCNLPGIRVPKCTRWRPQRIHNKTYRQVRGRMLGHCSNAERKGSDDAFDGTEEFESARRDGFDVRDKTLVIQTCVTNACRFDHVPRKC